MANRNDASQMKRLGQLQGQLRQQRDLAAAQAADRNYNGPSAQDQQRAETLKARAMDLASRGFSKGAQRVMGISGEMTKPRNSAGIDQGIDPSEIATANEYAKQQAETDIAQAQATQAQTTQRQQGILQGLMDQMNSPDLTDTQRQSLIDRYLTLTGGRNFIETQSVVGYDREGSPLLATVQMDPVTGQTLGGIDSNMPTYGQALVSALAKVKADPDSKPMLISSTPFAA